MSHFIHNTLVGEITAVSEGGVSINSQLSISDYQFSSGLCSISLVVCTFSQYKFTPEEYKVFREYRTNRWFSVAEGAFDGVTLAVVGEGSRKHTKNIHHAYILCLFHAFSIRDNMCMYTYVNVYVLYVCMHVYMTLTLLCL